MLESGARLLKKKKSQCQVIAVSKKKQYLLILLWIKSVVGIYSANLWVLNKGQTRICYVSPGETILSNCVFEEDESFSKGFIKVGIISSSGTIPLMRVPELLRVKKMQSTM